ncbi:leucine-rich repeat flightless-interacting protein 1 isoform X10 [Rhinolophus ferrumequinum]|uniref:leucine-rich repeat flightless-interacting protein 1 isoform X10 n=1 Tax=Rhinolophus ferrumequinum TaxID=59479 RepID=UPI00140F9F73|nr:leucine-rich repeat flightless-interacting protein 1 isoform X10 [Rhinolophus ferrumequinum]
MSVGSRGSLRSQPDLQSGGPCAWNSSYSGDGRSSTLSSSREEKLGLCCSDLGLFSSGLTRTALSAQSGNRPSYLYSAARPAGSYQVLGASCPDSLFLSQASGFNDSSLGGARRGSTSASHAPSEHSGHLNSSSRASSRASSARASPVVEERPEKDFNEKGSRNLPGLSAATLASLGGTSSRRGSGDTSISMDTEASIREIKELNEIKDQIQDVEGRYMQGLKEMKDSLAEVEEKHKKAMVSNAELDNEKTNFMYQVDTLKDTLLELEEQLAESRRQYEEKNKEFEREKHAHSLLQFQFAEVKAALKQREEMLEKHGIILNSEIATNGETSDTLNNVGFQAPTKMTKEELNVLKATGDGTLGRANEVEVKNEIVENVGKREILQNTEQEQHKEEPVEDCVDTEVLRPGDKAEDQKTSEDSGPSLGTVAHAADGEQVESHVLASTSFLEHTEQVGSNEVTSTADGRAGASRLGHSDSEMGQGPGDALDVENQGGKSAEGREQEKQDFKTHLGELSTKPHEESAPLPISEVERVSSTDTGGPSGNPSHGMAEAELTGLREQVGTVASSPPEHSSATVRRDEKWTVGVPKELDPSTGQGLENELTKQEVAEPREAPVQSTGVGGENNEEEDEGRELRDEKPVQTEVQTIPSCPATKSSAQEVAGPSMVEAQAEPLCRKEPSEEKKDQQGEALDSPQKKTKNKKKKNKKKKSPAPVETLTDVEKDLTFQNPDVSEVEEEPVKSIDHKSGVETQHEVPKHPQQDVVVGSSENIDCPESPHLELDGTLDQANNGVSTKAGTVLAEGEPLPLEGAVVQAPGTGAGGDGLDEGVRKDGAAGEGATPGSSPEPGADEASRRAQLGNGRPSMDTDDAFHTEHAEGCVTSEYPSARARKGLVSISLENDDLAPAGDLGDFNSDSKEETRGRDGKDKSKEDCALS